jgi:hypothetical protein
VGSARKSAPAKERMMNERCSICGISILRDPITGWDQGHNAQPVRMAAVAMAAMKLS